LSIGDAKESGSATLENVGVRALRFPRQPVESRESGDASRGTWKNAAEEAQRFRKGFGAAIGVGDKKSRTPKSMR